MKTRPRKFKNKNSIAILEVYDKEISTHYNAIGLYEKVREILVEILPNRSTYKKEAAPDLFYSNGTPANIKDCEKIFECLETNGKTIILYDPFSMIEEACEYEEILN